MFATCLISRTSLNVELVCYIGRIYIYIYICIYGSIGLCCYVSACVYCRTVYRSYVRVIYIYVCIYVYIVVIINLRGRRRELKTIESLVVPVQCTIESSLI